MKTTKLLLPLFFTTLLLHADEFDMFDTVDKVDSSKRAFTEDETFVNARLKLSYQKKEQRDNEKKLYLNLNKTDKHYGIDVRIVADEDEQNINIKELFYKGEFSPTNIYEIGRMNVKEGVARGYNPSDFFKGSTSLTLSSDPKEIKDNRLGSVMVQNTLFFDDFTLKAIYSPKIAVNEDSVWGSKKDYGLHLDETNYENRSSLYLGYSGIKDLSSSLIFHKNEDDFNLGVNLSYVKDSWIFYTESAFTKSKNAITKSIESLNLSPTVQNSFSSDKENIQKAVLGVNYSYDNISTNIEYIFNSGGLDKRDWESWFDLAKNSPQIGKQLGAIRGDISKKEEKMSRDSLFLFSRVTDIQTDLDASALLWINPYDKSTLSQVGLEYATNDNLQTNVYLRNYQGSKESEYGSNLDDYQILVESEYFF